MLRGVYGFFPAQSVGDDIQIYADESRNVAQATFHMLRQQASKPDKAADKALYCLADFVAPKSSGVADWLGAFEVTAGIGVDEYVKRLREKNELDQAFQAQILADRLAEAFAEYLHKQARIAWGYGHLEEFSNEDLVAEKYRGIRPAHGYPACPDHTEKRTLFNVLEAEKNSGITLTENYAMWPASSVSGLYIAHPDAKYISVGKIGKDQVEDYAARKKMAVADVEKWLGPNLNYDPK